MRSFIALAVVLFGLQATFWYHTSDVLPDMSIVPDVPSEATVKALSLGDEQFFFRLLGLQLQNAGDTFGRFTALKKYDFNKLYHWFRLLDTLDEHSNYIPSMATYYFSQTQNKPDVKYVVDYLIEHAAHRPEEKWWWLVQAIYLANHKLENPDLALKIANYLTGDYKIPLWAKQMPAFIHEQRGENDAALSIIENLLADQESLTQQELTFMQIFVKDRLNKMEQLQDSFDKAQQHLELQKQQDPSAVSAKGSADKVQH